LHGVFDLPTGSVVVAAVATHFRFESIVSLP
jgi:hypothetical protein